MKQYFKSFAALCVAIVIAFSIVTIAGAEETTPEEGSSIISISDNDGTKAYQLIWKYKKENGHYYKRRWNMTLGIWYDANWILVY